MDWIHCNSCHRQPSNNKKFYLTSCGHLFCEDCASKVNEKCVVCKQQCMVLVLAAPLKPDVAIYFTEPSEILQQRFKEVVKVIEFQKSHGSKLLACYQEKASALNEKLKEAIKKLEEIEKQKTALKQENVRLKDENATLKEEISLLKQVINQSPCNDGKGYRYSGAPSFFGSTSSQARNSIVSSPLTDRTNSMTSGTPITMRRLSLLTPPVAGKMGVNPGSRHLPNDKEQLSRHLLRTNSQPQTPLVNKKFISTTSASSHSNLAFQSQPSKFGIQRHSGEVNVTNATYYSPSYSDINKVKQPESSSTCSPAQRPIGLSVSFPIRSELKKYLESRPQHSK